MRAIGRIMLGLVLFICTACASGATAPDEVPSPSDQATVLETVVVTGVMPGPGMWRVHRGGHSLWILGTLQPVARRMRWESGEVERIVSDAQVILYPPTLRVDLGMGRLRTLMLLPALLGARKNPDGDRLVEQVSAEDYARWLQLKQNYLGRDRAVEKRRPIFAADALYRAALERSDLQIKGLVSPVVKRAARRHGIPVERPQVEVRVDDPRGAIREFRETEINDAACFRKTLDHLEQDLEKMRLRANAWATGDMLTLRQVTYEDQSRACMDAVFESRFAERQGIRDLAAKLRATWLETAGKILDEHERAFAVLPLGLMLGPDGYLAELAARGYVIEEP